MSNNLSNTLDITPGKTALMSINEDWDKNGDEAKGRKLDVRNPEDRLSLFHRMQAIANDPRVASSTRARAKRTAKNLQAVDRMSKGEALGGARKFPSYIGLVLAVILWGSLFGMRAFLASKRIEKCWSELSGTQLDICLRHAMEGRDEAIMLALSGPVFIVIALILYRHLRASTP